MQIEKMKNEQLIDSDDSDCFIIDDEDNEQKSKVDKLLIKKSPNGNYTVEKEKQIKKLLPAKKFIKPSNQTMFYMVPVFKNNMCPEEMSKICSKYIVEKPHFPSNASYQNISIPNFKICNMNVDQDPIIDSTNNEDLELCPTNLLESDSEDDVNISKQESSLQYDSGISRFDSEISSIDDKIFNLKGNKFKLTAETSFESGINSPTLDPIILSRSLDGEYCIKRDCFFGEKSTNLSEYEVLSRHSSLEKKIKYSDMQLEEPVLEKLFSTVTDISNSQSTTISISSLDCDLTERNDDNFYNEEEKNLVDEDGSLRVITKSDSNVFIAGYD